MRLEIDEPFEIDVKRFYLPVNFNVDCAHCKMPIEVDLEDSYLSYPTIGADEELGIYCEECDEETLITLVIKLDVEYKGNKKL